MISFKIFESSATFGKGVGGFKILVGKVRTPLWFDFATEEDFSVRIDILKYLHFSLILLAALKLYMLSFYILFSILIANIIWLPYKQYL